MLFTRPSQKQASIRPRLSINSSPQSGNGHSGEHHHSRKEIPHQNGMLVSVLPHDRRRRHAAHHDDAAHPGRLALWRIVGFRGIIDVV
jgi:hypothetical protein